MKHLFHTLKTLSRGTIFFFPLAVACTPVERNFTPNEGSSSSGSASSSGGTAECVQDADCPPTNSDPFCTRSGCSPEGICIVLPDNEGSPCPEGSCHNGACLCPQNWAQCNGICTDIATDSLNCGSCGHDCQGVPCSNGLCSPSLIASGQGGATDIAANTEGVVWTNSKSGEVMIYRKSSGIIESLAKSQMAPGPLVLTATDAYWANQGMGGGEILRVSLGGGIPQGLTSTQNSPIDMAAGLNYLFWIEFDGNSKATVRRTGLMGGGNNNIYSANGDPRGIAVQAGDAYWTNAETNNSSIMVSNSGSGTKTVVSGLGTPTEILLVQGTLYFIDAGFARLDRVSTMGGPVENVFTGPPWPRRLAADEKFIYWTQDDGAVRRMPLGSVSMPEFVAMGFGDLGAIAVDATHIYWIDKQSEIYGILK